MMNSHVLTSKFQHLSTHGSLAHLSSTHFSYPRLFCSELQTSYNLLYKYLTVHF